MVSLLRRYRLGLLLGPLCVKGCLVVLLVAGIGWFSDLCGEWWRAEERRGKLQQDRKETDARLALRKEIAMGLIEERMTLLEAGARAYQIRKALRALNPEALPLPAGVTEEEACCLFAIEIVRDFLLDQPTRLASVLPRLEAEWQGYRQQGRIQLPLDSVAPLGESGR